MTDAGELFGATGDDAPPTPEDAPKTRTARQRNPLRRVKPDDDGAGGDATPVASRARRTRAPKDDAEGTTAERPPRTARQSAAPSGRRVSLAWLFSAIYGGAGTVMERVGDDALLPTARVLGWNAPVAGRAFDELVAGTALDRVLQPLAKRGDKLEAVGNVVGLPMLVYALTTNPELWPTLEPIAREMFYANLAAMAPTIKAKKDREREMRKVLTELADEGMIGRDEAGNVPDADELFRTIFAPPEHAEPGEPPPAPAGP